ncbi:MAG: A/G-specific adenine glycosylase, partial [Candidatus Angelobacter sp.]
MSRRSPLATPARKNLREILLRWYDRHQRKLPWRGQRDPYLILVSEIMLQQTRVAVVEERYKRFIKQFPTVERLARARASTVLAAWSGLGYYRRARSLHAAARLVVRSGGFPRSAEDLQQLPGIGRYTAAALASIAFAEPAAVVDGNVRRVLSRMTGRNLSERQCWIVAGVLLDGRRPGDFNQALMELGAVVCLPTGEPLCGDCPVASLCASRRSVTRPRRQKARRKAVLSYSYACKDGQVLLRRRPNESSLMPRMWELPEMAFPATRSQPLLKLRHSITVTDYTVTVFRGKKQIFPNTRWVPLRNVERLPLTGLAR